METVEQLLFCFVSEHRFNQLDSTELKSLIDEIGRKVHKLKFNERYELLNSLYFNTTSNGYSSLLHICFYRINNHNVFKYDLWRGIYIFCELGLHPMNPHYLPSQQIEIRNSMKAQYNSLREIHEKVEMKKMSQQILTLKHRDSTKSVHSVHSVHSLPSVRSMHSVDSTISSIEFNIGDINDIFGDNDVIIEGQSNNKNLANQPKRISPFHSKLQSQPRSWTDLQLNDNDQVTTRNIIEVLKYCGKYDEYESPALFTIYVKLASCCTILGNAFTSLKQFNPQILKFALCKLPNSKLLQIVDNISYYDYLKMNKYAVDMKRSVENLKYNINAQYKIVATKRFSEYLCYLFLIRQFYKTFTKESLQRFVTSMIEPYHIEIKHEIMDMIKMYTFEDISYCDTQQISEEIEQKWICIWFDSLEDHLDKNYMYNDQWILWICQNILKSLSVECTQFLSAYLTQRGESFIKNCRHYQLKCCFLNILEKKLKTDNFNENDLLNYINPRWFLHNVVLMDTLLVQHLLICCVNHKNYKDLCVYSLWTLLTKSVFEIESSFFDQVIQIIQKFSNNNIYLVNGCCQNILDSIFSIRPSLLENNVYIQKNITSFLINIANRNNIGQLTLDMNKGLIQCCTQTPGNVALLKILVTNPNLLDFKVCVERGIIDMIHSRMQFIQNESIKNIFYSWYRYNTRLLQPHSSRGSIGSSSVHSITSTNDEQCCIM